MFLLVRKYLLIFEKRSRVNYFTKNDYELVSRNSVFTLAPAGYGRWTYRFFQTIQWSSIPVLISDDVIISHLKTQYHMMTFALPCPGKVHSKS